MTDQQSRTTEARRSVYRASSSPEGEAFKHLLDADIAFHTRGLLTASTLEEVFRAQGAIKSLEKMRSYFTEPPIFDRQ